MKRKLWILSAIVILQTMFACSDSNVAGSSEDPNVITATKTQSSSSDIEPESSSVETLGISSSVGQSSSSSETPVLCKAGGSTGGCFTTSYGDLWTIGFTRVATKSSAKDSSEYGDRAGELFFETDSIEGGKSEVTWDDGSMNPRITEFGTGYLSAVILFDKGDMNKEAYVNVGFNVAGFDSDGEPVAADISDWNGICVSYVASVDVSLRLDLGDSVNQKIDFAMPSVTLEKGQSTQCFDWTQFRQPESKNEHEIISGEDAAKRVVNILFNIQSPEEIVGFKILAIGTNRDE